MNSQNPTQIHATGEATGFIPAPGDKGKPITVIGTNSIRAGFDATCLQQALNARSAPGVTDLVLNPDAHAGYGAPVGCVLTSPTQQLQSVRDVRLRLALEKTFVAALAQARGRVHDEFGVGRERDASVAR